MVKNVLFNFGENFFCVQLVERFFFINTYKKKKYIYTPIPKKNFISHELF